MTESKTYFFIDESGDPSFYSNGGKSMIGNDGFKPVFMIGMIKVEDKKVFRKAILDFVDSIKSDPLYRSSPCIVKTDSWMPHASYDNIDVQLKFIEFLRALEGYKFYCVIGRKRLSLFHKKHNKSETEFYFDILYHLIKDRLKEENVFHQIYLAYRNKSTQAKLKESIDKAIARDNERRRTPININYQCDIVHNKDTPELAVVDYLLWALQRYIIKKEGRFFLALEHKYNLIIDLYDFDNKNKYYYTPKENAFRLEKATEFRIDGY